MNTPYKKALEAGDKYYFTGKPCKHGHIDKRDTTSGHCVSCEKSRDRTKQHKKYYQLNREKILTIQKECRAINQDKFNKRQRDYRAKNPEKLKEYAVSAKHYQREYYIVNNVKIKKSARLNREMNPEKYKESDRKWNINNRGRFNALRAKRRAAQKKRTPVWLSKSDHTVIIGIYDDSIRISKETGIEHVVDHIIPLQGKVVSGLHVPSNLQILTKNENSCKYNTFNIE
jgi:hypothetical protein